MKTSLTIHSPEVLAAQRDLGCGPLQALRHVQQRKALKKQNNMLMRRCSSMLLMTPVRGDIA